MVAGEEAVGAGVEVEGTMMAVAASLTSTARQWSGRWVQLFAAGAGDTTRPSLAFLLPREPRRPFLQRLQC